MRRRWLRPTTYTDTTATQTLTRPTPTPTAASRVSDQFTQLSNDVGLRLSKQDQRIDRQGAMSAAMMNMAINAAGSRSQNGRIGVGAGWQNGESALSVGYSKADRRSRVVQHRRRLQQRRQLGRRRFRHRSVSRLQPPHPSVQGEGAGRVPRSDPAPFATLALPRRETHEKEHSHCSAPARSPPPWSPRCPPSRRAMSPAPRRGRHRP